MKKVLLFLWCLALFLLPFDNFPFFESGFIKPLAIFPLSLLIFFFLILFLGGKEKLSLNKIDICFLFFVFLIFLNSLLSVLLLPESEVKGITSYQRFLEVLYFLPLIFIFYFAPRIIIKEKKDVKNTFQWLILAFIFPLLWGILQSIYVFSDFSWEESIFGQIENLLVTKGGVINNRIPLLTAEPSFAAVQLLLLILPILFFCFYFKFSFFKKINTSVGKFNIETVILFLAFFCLVMTFSITGYIALIFLIVIWLFVFLKQKRFYGVALKLVSASLLLLIVAAPYLSGFFQRTTNISSIKNYDFLSVFQSEESYLVRSTGWMVGLKEIFERPLLGIGFRNTMFYYKDLVPKWAMANGVVQTYADPSYLDLVPTPKGFFPGILGETGLIGLTLFLILYIASLIKIIQLKPKEPSEKVIKYSILFSLFSIIPLGLSLDFTYPYFWLILGLSSSIIEADRRGLKRG